MIFTLYLQNYKVKTIVWIIYFDRFYHLELTENMLRYDDLPSRHDALLLASDGYKTALSECLASIDEELLVANESSVSTIDEHDEKMGFQHLRELILLGKIIPAHTIMFQNTAFHKTFQEVIYGNSQRSCSLTVYPVLLFHSLCSVGAGRTCVILPSRPL